MQDFERAYRGAGQSGATAGLDVVTAGSIDKRVACVYRPPQKAPPAILQGPHPQRRRGTHAGDLTSWPYSSSSPRFSCDSETKRRRRVAAYKAYGAKSELKDAVRRGLLWIKVRCSDVVQGR